MKTATLWTVLIGCVLAVIVPCGSARGAPVSQTLTLLPGWNAVFLEVQPELNPSPPVGCTPTVGRTLAEPCEVFAGVTGLESVWAWNRSTSPAEYIQNPALPIEPSPYMLAYVPGNPLISNLHAIRGETAYLIKIAAGAPASQLKTVTGEPAVPKVAWQPNSFNFVGFHLDASLPAGSMPTYFDFFSGSPAHYLTPMSGPAGPEIYVLDNATGTWRQVLSPDKMKAGEAFWVYCQGSSTFGGPLSVQLEQGTGLDFGTVLDQQVLVLRNEYTDKRSATVRALTVDESAPYGIYFGTWVQNPPDSGSSRHTWAKLSTAGVGMEVLEGGQSRLRLGAVRAGLAAGGAYETNVEVSDGLGVRILLPAQVEGIGIAGLWVGNVVVSKVTDNASGMGTPTPVGSPFFFRVIVHVSDEATPTIRLLRDVVQLWREGTWKPDPDNLGHKVVDEPGSFVLVANPLRVGEFSGSALRDGQQVGRRISTAAFGFDGSVPKSAGSFAPGETLEFVVTLKPDDATNPFRHRYHKDHPAAKSYEVARHLRLQFLLDDPAATGIEGVPYLGWGSSEVGGLFSETIGLRRASPADPSLPDPGDASYDVDVEGTFRLRRVSDVGQLQL